MAPCVCGHAPEDHRDETRECEAEGCKCVMYEDDLSEYDDEYGSTVEDDDDDDEEEDELDPSSIDWSNLLEDDE